MVNWLKKFIIYSKRANKDALKTFYNAHQSCLIIKTGTKTITIQLLNQDCDSKF